MQPRIRIKSEIPVGKWTILDQSTRSLSVVNDLYSLWFISYGGLNGEGGGAFSSSSPEKVEGGLLEGGVLFERVGLMENLRYY